MKRLIAILFIFIGKITLAQQAVTISPQYPQRGQTVTVTYDPAAAGAQIPASAATVTLVFSYSTFYDLPWRIDMEKKGGVWTASFVLAKFAAFATFYLQSGEAIQKPGADSHYEVMVYEDKTPVQNSNLYRGYSLSAQMRKSPEVAVKQAEQYEKELTLYPANYEAKLRLLVYKMSKADDKDKKWLREQAHKVIADKFYEAPTVMGNINKVTMGYLIIGENSRLDSIRKVIREKYPDSEVGRDLVTDMISKEKDTAKQIALFEKELKKETNQNAASFSAMHRRLFELYAAKKNSSKALLHAPKFSRNDDSPYKPETLKMIAQTLMENNIALDSARAYAQRSLAMADKFPTGIIRHFPETGYILPYANDSTRKAVFDRSSANLLSIIALIDMKAGQLPEAMRHMDKALQLSSDKETLDNAAVFFQQTDNTARLAELQQLREKLLQEKIAKLRTNRPVPTLNTFVDMKGEPVPPETWKNKILVIDFWATWCIPCMEEMPYLQKIYDKYRNNPDIAFLVVNSGARNTLKDAQGWSGHKKYSFPVYYNTDPAIGDKFKFNIIPATYIINKEGNIQFANIGFEGAEVETKLKLQIEMLLNN